MQFAQQEHVEKAWRFVYIGMMVVVSTTPTRDDHVVRNARACLIHRCWKGSKGVRESLTQYIFICTSVRQLYLTAHFHIALTCIHSQCKDTWRINKSLCHEATKRRLVKLRLSHWKSLQQERTMMRLNVHKVIQVSSSSK